MVVLLRTCDCSAVNEVLKGTAEEGGLLCGSIVGRLSSCSMLCGNTLDRRGFSTSVGNIDRSSWRFLCKGQMKRGVGNCVLHQILCYLTVRRSNRYPFRLRWTTLLAGCTTSNLALSNRTCRPASALLTLPFLEYTWMSERHH